MKGIIGTILKLFGWQKLLKWCWEAIHPELVKLASKTETKIDDNFVEFFNKIIMGLVESGDIEE